MRENPSNIYIQFVISMLYRNEYVFYSGVGIPNYMLQAMKDGVCEIFEFSPNNFKVKVTELGLEVANQLAIIYYL